MTKIIPIALFICLFQITKAFAGTTYPHELMFLNCTQQIIHVTNGDMLPYKFSMDPLFEAINGYSPSYSFDIPPQFIYKHPISIFINSYKDGGMHMYLSGALNSEISMSLVEGDYITLKLDTRYVTLIGYNDNWESGRGNRTIFGLGCENTLQLNGTLANQPMSTTFKIKLRQ